MKLMGAYKNGNYMVYMFDDGTKIRSTPDNEFISQFPESIDLKITNSCLRGCSYCHEGSNPGGEHGRILDLPFIDTLHPYTEVAIGGGDPLSHPDLVSFLRRLKDRNVIANITLHQQTFVDNYTLIDRLKERGLLHGVGVSMVYPSQIAIDRIKRIPNTVIHLINGVVTKTMLDFLSNNELKVLFLGYKNIRKGKTYALWLSDEIEANQKMLFDELRNGLLTKFDTVSFDNLAIEQLKVKDMLSPSEWDSFYMGDDGTHTMYIDAVLGNFAISSVSETRFPIKDTIDEMFEVVKSFGQR